MTDASNPILISIEGNIGAGKSYLLKALKAAHPEWCFIDEPVDDWQTLKNGNNESILQLFYKDQKRWSYTFQNCALLSRFQNIENAIQHNLNEKNRHHSNKRQVFITERCLDTDYEVFAKMLHNDGIMDDLEFELYEKWFCLLKKTAVPLSAIILVETPPEKCAEQIGKRARSGEAGIPIEYLNSLHKQQGKWLNSLDIPKTRVVSSDVEKVEAFVSNLEAPAILETLAGE